MIRKPINQQFSSRVSRLSAGYVASMQIDQIAAEIGMPVEQILKLDAGENQFGPTLELDWQTLANQLRLYPDGSARELRELIAEDVGVTADMVLVGNGSDELIDLLNRLFLEPGRTLLDFQPTFPMFKIYAELTGADVIVEPRQADFTINVPTASEQLQRASLAFIANPNNPTGTLTSVADIEKLLQVGTPLVVDEAYFEFCGVTVVPLLKKYDNLIVLRTFSKWAGLAGLRIGFVLARPDVIAQLQTIKAPYNVNVIAQTAALSVLRNKPSYMAVVKQLIEGREWFIQQMSTLPNWKVFPSEASCVTLFPQQVTAAEVVQRLRKVGIIVKAMSFPDTPEVIRISAAPLEQMKRVFSAVKKLG